MLENKKNVRKIRNIIVVLMAIVLVLGIFIKVRYTRTEIQTIAAKNLEHMKSESTTETIEVDHGTLDPIYRAEWTKVSSSLDKSTGTMQIVVNGAANGAKSRDGTVLTGIQYLNDVISSVTSDDVNVYIDGELAEDVRVAVSEVIERTNEGTGKTEVQYTITLSDFEVAVRKTGKNFKEWSGNVALQFARGTLQDMYGSEFDEDGNLVNAAGNSNLAKLESGTSGISENIVVQEAVKQTANSTSTEANMFIDLIKPEFTYSYSESDIDYEAKTAKVVFDVADKYFNSTNLATDTNADLITVLVDGELPGDTNGDGTIGDGETLAITKTLTKTAIYVMNTETSVISTQATDYTIQSTERKVGERYELVVKKLQQDPNDSFDFSGIITLGFAEGIISDLSGNKNDATTITIGIDEKGGTSTGSTESAVTVDVVDPIWRVQNLQQTTTDGVTTVTMDIIGTDKFFKEATLEKDDIQLIMSGVNVSEVDENGNPTVVPNLVKDLSAPVYIKWNNEDGTYVETTKENANGVKYIYTLTNIEEADAQFIAERAKYAEDTSTGRVYQEYSGQVKVVIPADTIEDESGNQNIITTIDDLGHIDTLKPKVIKVSSTAQINTENVELSKHIIVFDIVDKYLDTSAITMTDTSKIHVYLDGELTEIDTDGDGTVDTDTVTKTITKIEQLNATVDSTTRKVGYRYTLELSNFEKARTAIDYAREYTDWSGALTIKIDANTAYDVNPNDSTDRRGNDETILAGNEANTSNVDYADFVDYVKPDATYQYADTDVDYEDREFTMVFDITDKFFYSEDLDADGELDEGEDVNGNGELDDSADLELSDLQIYIDGYEDDMNLNSNITKSLRSEAITNEVLGETKVIGRRYTLVLSHLEQIQKIEGNNYLDYSGSITVIIPKDKVKDSSENGNDLTSITSGINIPGGSIEDIKNVDVVRPLWEKESFTIDINNKTATINILGTDKYFWQDDATTTADDKYSTLTSDEIKLYVNGMETTGSIDLSEPDELTEERNENGDTKTVQYGVRYQITITDFSIDKNQVKLQLAEGSLVDQSNNESAATDLMIYNTLISTAIETEATSAFLGEIAPEGKTTITRQDIEQVIFVDSIEGSTATGVQNVWDASAQRDRSILAWYNETEAPYTVYVGSNDDIYGNIDSSYLFSYIGYGESCDDTTPVTNLAGLHTENVTNMSYMFSNFGYRKMITLNLGNFYTANVTNMEGMFNNCGNLAMTTLNLGTTFNTSKVTDMSNMFSGCGATSLGTLDLGATGVTFNTTLVTDMSNMFNGCGESSLTTFSLGSTFYTSAVTDMNGMFQNFGYKLNSFTLGNNFNTSAVTNMNSMFKDFAKTSTTMTSLDLGKTFYTSAVTDMTDMFNGCGNTAMTSIDLGPAFTNIAETNTGFVTNCGKSGAVINAPESIYNDMKHFKLSTDSTTTIEYTQGTINPKYKPEWSKVSSSLTIDEDDVTNSTMTIVVSGKVNTTVYENALQTVTSTLIAGPDSLNLINVYVDGQLAKSITKTITANSITETEVQYTITLSNFQEEVRQSTKNFKEWAGNVALQFAKGTLLDAYGNKNMAQIDVDPDGDGTTEIQQIQVKDTGNLDANVEIDKMFADYIKPEFTYEFGNTVIGSGPEGDKKVKVVFDVTDKYFDSTDLESDSNADLITVRVDGKLPGDTNGDGVIGDGETLAITKTLTKTAIFVMNKETKVITTEDIDYEIQTTEQKVGERYELVIDDIQQDPNDSSHFSGIFTLSFNSGIVEDKSGNENDATVITIGIDEPGSDSDEDDSANKEEQEPEIVDVVDPIWTGPADVNTIERTDANSDGTDDDKVNITILGSDKFYASNTLTTNKIKVYVDDTLQETISKQLTEITDATQLQTLATNAGLPDDVQLVGYVLTLSNFGDQQTDIDGITKIVIEEGTIVDSNGNINRDPVTIYVGNEDWEETNEPLESTDDGYPRYPAFRNDIVDFIDPIIKYTYSKVEVDTDGDGEADSELSTNPDINYETKQVTVKFTVTDRYLLGSDLINTTVDEDGNTIQVPKNITIKVAGTDVTSQVTTRISETAITNGKEYTLVVSNLQQDPNTGFDFSGPMQLIFAEGAVDDTSGNTNAPTTISLETHVGDDVVDVVDPIISVTEDGLSGRNEENSINETDKTVTVIVQGEDKYLSQGKLLTEEFNNKIKVRIEEHDGDIIEDASATNLKLTKADGTVIEDQDVLNELYPTRIVKTITVKDETTQKIGYQIVLSNFGTFEGKVTLVIPEDSIIDTSGNGNIETSVLVGNSTDTTAFKDSIVDFTNPTWNYATSSITRDRNDVVNDDTDYVTIKIIGHDNYYGSNSLTKEQITVLIDGIANTDVVKDLQEITDTTELTNLANQAGLTDKIAGRPITDVLVGYTLTLKNFGTNEEKVEIQISTNTTVDTSGNTNILTPMDVGNTTWVENNEPLETTDDNYPAYDGFKNSIVDYIKPVITLESAVLDRDNSEVTITFDATDRNYATLDKLSTNVIETGDIQIFVDTGSNEREVTSTIGKTLTRSTEAITKTVDGKEVTGYQYTLVLNGFDEGILDDDVFKSHSGVIKLVIASGQISDTSGNTNNKTTLSVNEFEDGTETTEIADFLKPIIYLPDRLDTPEKEYKYINWEEKYALITLRVTDRFYDTSETNILELGDITLYEENADGSDINITNQFYNTAENINNMSIKKSSALKDEDGNIVGYDYTIRLDNFEEELKMKINIPAEVIGDTSGNFNDGYTVATDTAIEVDLDNRRPTWNYVSAITSNFEDDDEDEEGQISFTVKGEDKFLDLTNSNLVFTDTKKDIKILKDGVDITSTVDVTINYLGTNTTEEANLDPYKKYQIDVTGLPTGEDGTGTYSLVIAENTLVDEFKNYSAATTISFYNSAITSNTANYVNVTYHVTPDMETVHKSYVHELMSVNDTGTNTGTETYRPSSLGELFNNGENPLFAEPMYVPSVNGYTIDKVYSPKGFTGWAVCDEEGNVADGATVYGLYDDIPKTVTHLKALWEKATIVFVSADGDNSNNGQLPTTPVKDLATAYTLLDSSGTAETNIIVIMDEVKYESTSTLSGNATITSIYAGSDYRTQGAELKVASNMIVDGDIIFDNIELYVDSTDNQLISNYSGDITLGRGITTPSSNYTFGSIIGGNVSTESTGELGTHTIRVEAGKYNNIIAGSSFADGVATTTTKSVTHNVVIGNMRDTAVSVNDKLTITGYVAIGENEKQCFPTGATTTTNAEGKTYANVTLYSGTIGSEGNTAIYLRSINGQTDGLMNFEMFGGVVTGNVYGGSRISSSSETTIFNTMNFYGGELTGNIFGQGLDDTFTGSSSITLQGIFSMSGNVYGGSNRTATTTTSVGKGNSTILINSGSVTVDGNIYGGGNITEESTGYITGTTNITLRVGTVKNIYGSGYNCGNTGETNITIDQSGIVPGNIFGGAYHNQARKTSNITVLGGTIKGNIYGGNDNISSQLDGDAFFQDVNIIIGKTTDASTPTINGIIYGGGKYDKVDVSTIELIECANTTSVFGGSDADAMTITSNIYLKGMTVNEIYGGGNQAGTVSISNIYLQSGTAGDVFGGGNQASSTQANISLEGTADVTSIYGGPSTSGKVSTSNVVLKSGTVENVFGGGDSAEVGTANVTLDGITIDTIHGGSKDAGLTTETNVTLKSGTVKNVFGGGRDVGATTTNVTQEGATVTNIYGGNNSLGTESVTGGETGTANVEIINSTVENIYGGNYLKGTTRYTYINVHGTSTVTGDIYGGGYQSDIGKGTVTVNADGTITTTVTEAGTTTINIAAGTVNGDINGGSKQGIVYGTTNINVGFDAIGNASLTPGAIDIKGIIYGAGSTLTSGDITVVGDTNITMDNGTTYPITYYTTAGKEKSIYGSGKGGGIYSNTTDKSTIHLTDFGTADSIYLFKSIEDTGTLYIGNSVIELIGALDKTATNTDVGHYYTLNTITNALTIYNNTTLYTQRGFNKVGGYYSYVNQKSTKATVTIADGVTTTNVNNKLYTLEGINLIFAKKEVTLANKSSLKQEEWGEVTGMTYFGTYKNTSSGKQYDLSLFKAGTYVEAQYNSSHNINADGFYTTVLDEETDTEIEQIIDTTNYTNYCDWIVNAPTISYDVDLVASAYGQNSVAELLLNYTYASDYTYAPGTVYTVNQVSTNALKLGIELVDPSDPDNIPTISENANNTFGLTMETMPSGWKEQASTTILTANNGSFGGDSTYTSDAQTTPGSIKFKVYNSLNITEEKDLGNINIILTGQQPISGSGTEAYTFKVAIAVNLQTIVDELKQEYVPSFTDSAETTLNYSTDSRVDLSYLLYNNLETSPYTTEEDGKITDYRVLSTTLPLPAKTKLTMKDYSEGKVYYYQVASDTDYYATETVNGVTRYLYKLTKFIEMGSSDASYVDSTTYYHSDEKYVLEKYDISIDFIDADVDNNVSADILALAQETYLELRDVDGNVKYDNGDTTIEYNLKVGGNAVATADIETESNSYSVSESIEIPIEISASILEQSGILDTKYHDQIAGIAVQIVGENNIRIKSPELQNFNLTNNDTGEVYTADSNGVIRMPIIEGLGSNTGNYTLSITQVDVPPGAYKVQVLLYTADDGLYYGTETEMNPGIDPTLEFNITFISRLAGSLGVEAKDQKEETRIINKSTGLSLVEGSQTTNALDLVVGINNPTDETNIRVELYKRNATYTDLTDEKTYTGTTYTLVDIKDYLQGTWTEATEGSKEYVISEKKTYETEVEFESFEFQKAVKEGISTGEYKLVFKAYSDDTLVQTFSKTFIVTP